MKNKILKTFFAFAFIICTFTFLVSVKAETQTKENDEQIVTQEDSDNNEQESNISGIFDSDASDTAYKFSEGNNIYLPFVRYCSDRILIDKKLSGFGTCFSAQNIEVNADVEGVQVLFAADSIRVNNKMEYGILFAGTNVTISSNIDKSIIVFAGEKVTIAEDAVINGDIICYSSDIEINGTVKGSVLGASDNVTINGKIENDFRMQVTTLELDDKCVTGNVYIQTFNTDLTLPTSYEKAELKILSNDEDKNFDFSIIYTAIIAAALFTLVYYIINKSTKEKLFSKGLEKIQAHPITVLLSGSVVLLSIPAVLLVLVFLSAIGLYVVGVPVLIIYVVYLLLFGLLSTFVVGSFITEYMSKTKYLKEKSEDVKIKYVFAFAMYLILYIFARLPYIGGYITVLLVMLSIGCITCVIINKLNKQQKDGSIISSEDNSEKIDKDDNKED